MATAWVKSLQCKSSSFDDVVYNPKPKKTLLPAAASSCGNSSQALRDVVFLFPKHPHSSLPKKPPEKQNLPNHQQQQQQQPPKRAKPRPKPSKPAIPSSPPARPTTAPPFPTLTELPAGHSSRRVVEIIFGTSWSDRGGAASRFPGRIEMLFRVHNPARTVARFEEYRSAVRSRSGTADARCAADGNEMMRFHCALSLSSSSDGIYDASVACCAVTASPSPAGGGKVREGIRTFAGSGGAHESAGGGPGRRAMLVCRVIAGRVRAGPDPESSGESVGYGKGELVVFDPRAVLPCFLIIYKI